MEIRRNRDRRFNLDLEAVDAFLDTRDPIDARRLTRLSWWAKRRHHRAIYRAAKRRVTPTTGDALANVAVERSLTLPPRLMVGQPGDDTAKPRRREQAEPGESPMW